MVCVRHETSYGHMSGSFGFYFGEAVNPIHVLGILSLSRFVVGHLSMEWLGLCLTECSRKYLGVPHRKAGEGYGYK